MLKRILLAVLILSGSAAKLTAAPVAVGTPGVEPATVLERNGRAMHRWFYEHPGCPEGRLVVEFTVDVDGTASDASIVVSSGIPTYDQAFLADVVRYRFAPATKDGMKIASRKRIESDVERFSVCIGQPSRETETN